MSLRSKNSSSRTAASAPATAIARDLSLLLQTTATRDSLLIQLLATTGITPNELVNIKKTDLSTRNLRIRAPTTKHGIARNITLSPQLSKKLATHARSHDGTYLFRTRQSEQLTTRRVEQILKDACKAAGTADDITPRQLRNAYLAQAAKHSKDEQELRQLTGLKTITQERGLDEKELAKLKKTTTTAGRRERALIGLIIETHMRISEALALTKNDLKKLTLTTRLERQLATLTPHLSSHLFTTRQSTTMTPRRAEQLLKELGKKAGITLTPERLRATTDGGKADGGAP